MSLQQCIATELHAVGQTYLVLVGAGATPANVNKLPLVLTAFRGLVDRYRAEGGLPAVSVGTPEGINVVMTALRNRANTSQTNQAMAVYQGLVTSVSADGLVDAIVSTAANRIAACDAAVVAPPNALVAPIQTALNGTVMLALAGAAVYFLWANSQSASEPSFSFENRRVPYRAKPVKRGPRNKRKARR